MTDGRTHYDLLGVESGAAPDAIRAAYIDLMKRHHPNSPYRAANPLAADEVQTLNFAYAVLKDPAKRAAYDAELIDGGSGGLPAPLRADRRMPLVLRKKRRRRGQSMVPIAAVAAAFLAAGTWLGNSGRTAYPSSTGSFGAPAGPAASPFEVSPPHETAWIRRQAKLAATMGSSEAAHFSARCFDEARQVGSSSAADECLVFDLAYAYWREGETNHALPAYFQPELMQLRQTRALGELDRDAALLRLDSLRAATFSSLLELVNSPQAMVDELAVNSAQSGNAEIGANLAQGTDPPPGLEAQD